MSEMIDRLKQTIVYVQEGPCDPESVVRAIVEAMREPSDEMMAAVDCGGEKSDWPSGRAWKTAYRAMIDAALK